MLCNYFDFMFNMVSKNSFQIHNSGYNNSFNICQVCFLCKWHAYGRAMGEKGCVHILPGTCSRPPAPVFVYILFPCDLCVSVLCLCYLLFYYYYVWWQTPCNAFYVIKFIKIRYKCYLSVIWLKYIFFLLYHLAQSLNLVICCLLQEVCICKSYTKCIITDQTLL